MFFLSFHWHYCIFRAILLRVYHILNVVWLLHLMGGKQLQLIKQLYRKCQWYSLPSMNSSVSHITIRTERRIATKWVNHEYVNVWNNLSIIRLHGLFLQIIFHNSRWNLKRKEKRIFLILINRGSNIPTKVQKNALLPVYFNRPRRWFYNKNTYRNLWRGAHIVLDG